MKKILVIGASTGIKSINRNLTSFTASLLTDCEHVHINIAEYNNTPIFSVEDKELNGTPSEIVSLTTQFNTCDGFIISFAEHNGSFAAGYKNVIDWISTQGKDMFNHKPMFLMSTSPGPRGGQNVLNSAINYYPFMGGKVSASFSLPSFFNNFKDDQIIDKDLKSTFDVELEKFKKAL